MKHSLLACFFLLTVIAVGHSAMETPAKSLMPDTIVMNDGKTLHGLIIKNDAQKVILQQEKGEVEIPKAISVVSTIRWIRGPSLQTSWIPGLYRRGE